ncbi:arylamine N-acetyltransferase [Alphaproteobacteria bacterium]|nr:arylamine N-acetyltransferase [Alphaproteobacteria bacterium]
MTDITISEPKLSSEILTHILIKLDLAEKPECNLVGLNRVYAAYCGHVPRDNIQKRIWLTGKQNTPVTGGDPIEFFENWLAHGTGGTCFPASGGLHTLLCALGFDAKRVTGCVIRDGIEYDANHSSVMARVDGADFLVDPQQASFTALPIIPGKTSSAGNGIHSTRTVPVPGGFELQSFPGSNRQEPLRIRFYLENCFVSHAFFLENYALSAVRELGRSPFNDTLIVSRRFPGSLVIVGRGNRIEVSADNTVTKVEINIDERNKILIKELGISEEITKAIPPDEVDGPALPT